MDRTITIQRLAPQTPDASGSPDESWSDLMTLRAQQVQTSTDEYIRAPGATDETRVVFRTWWHDGITNNDRIVYGGIVHEIKELKEIGRRNGLEIRTLSYGKAP